MADKCYIWLQAKVSECGFGLWPRLYACFVCDALHRFSCMMWLAVADSSWGGEGGCLPVGLRIFFQ